MARIAGVDLPKDKRVEVALTYIYGIGRSRSRRLLSELGIDFDTRVKDLRRGSCQNQGLYRQEL